MKNARRFEKQNCSYGSNFIWLCTMFQKQGHNVSVALLGSLMKGCISRLKHDMQLFLLLNYKHKYVGNSF